MPGKLRVVIQWRHPRPFADCPVRAFKNAHAPSFLGNLQGWLLQLISIGIHLANGRFMQT
jgi:hypothetical protein